MTKNKLLMFPFYAQLWTGIAAMALSSYYQLIQVGLNEFNYYRMVFVGISTWTAYLFLNLLGLKENPKSEDPKVLFLKEYQTGLWSICGGLIFVIAVMCIGLLGNDFLLVAACAALVLLYEKLLPFFSIRAIPYLKTPIVCLTWAIMCTYFATNRVSLLQFFDCYIFVMAMMVAFDLRDVESDLEEGIANFTQKLGSSTSKLYGLTLLAGTSMIQSSYFGFDFRSVLIEFTILGIYFGTIRSVTSQTKDVTLYLGIESLMFIRLFHFLVQ